MRIRVLAAVFLSSFPRFALAQSAQLLAGATLGITTPGPMRWQDSRLAVPYPDPTERNSAQASPLVGLDVRLTLWKHLAIDAGLHGSETGYKHEHSGIIRLGEAFLYQERMQLRRVSLPLTIGYSFRLGSVKMRAGAGHSLTYFVRGLFQTETRVNGSPVSTVTSVDVFADNDSYTVGVPSSWKLYPRCQTQFRAKLDIQPSPKWMFGLAADAGHDMRVRWNDTRWTGPMSYVSFASNAYELIATYSLRRRDNLY